MASSFIADSQHQPPESHPHKRRRISTLHSQSSTHQQQFPWKSPSTHHNYSSNLLKALRRVRQHTPTSVSGSRAVRYAADKTLAIAAKGRSRWSRAILSNRMKLHLKQHKKNKLKPKFPAPVAGKSKFIPEDFEKKMKKLPVVDKRVEALSRLVPGCRKLSFPNLLEETTDYIAALQMQVRTMAALTDLLSGSSSNGSGSVNSSGSDPVRLS